MLFHIAHGYFHRFLLVFSFGIPLTKPPKHTKPLKIFKCLVRLKHLLLFNCITIEFVSLLLTKNSIKSSLGVPGRCRPAVNVPLLNVSRIKYREIRPLVIQNQSYQLVRSKSFDQLVKKITVGIYWRKVFVANRYWYFIGDLWSFLDLVRKLRYT